MSTDSLRLIISNSIEELILKLFFKLFLFFHLQLLGSSDMMDNLGQWMVQFFYCLFPPIKRITTTLANHFLLLSEGQEMFWWPRLSLKTKLWRITRPALEIQKYSIFGHYSGSNSMSKSGLIFNWSNIQISIFWMIMTYNSPITRKMAYSTSIFASIFDSTWLGSASIHQFYDLTSTWLKSQNFGIRLVNESRVGTQFARICWKVL